MPFFSIILPTFNRAHFLPIAIASVKVQTFEDWELIIVDDGSTDDTQSIVKSFAIRDKRVKYIFQENQERSVARNNGISNAHGKYICFLDSDDQYLSNNLEDWYKFLKDHSFPREFAYCNLIIESQESEYTASDLPEYCNKFDFVFTNPIIPARVCISKNLLENNLFETYMTIGEDVALWLKVIQNTDVLFSPHVGAKYYIHGENSVSTRNPAAVKMLTGFELFFKQYPQIRKQITTSVFNDYFSRILTNVAKYHYLRGDKRKAIGVLIRALLKSPVHIQTKYRLRLIATTLFSKDPNLYD